MFTYLFTNPAIFFLWFAALIVAITIHEFAHAYVADRLGDPTPRLMGRVTLNPIAHLDPIGTLAILLFRFGWGKPVQFNPHNLNNPRRDAAIISLAGPASNMILSLILSLVTRLPATPPIVALLLEQIITLNVILALFNLIPIHPLDGFKIVTGVLPYEYARVWESWEPYGTYILLFAILPITPFGSLISLVLQPPLDIILTLLIR
ncbi:site-2 protease family protein [Candidatus Roizmanbacteria bacterium]|nr:site-2 protease family protein [Candidatus Roizmanbacteria bacterium]